MPVSLQKYKWLLFIAAASLIPAFLFSLKTSHDKTVRIDGKTMGTIWSVVIPANHPKADITELKREIEQQLASINRQMSTYDQNSEISRFNDSRSTDWFQVSKETAEVVELAQKVSQLSNGAFDVTVGALVDLWGFGARPRKDKHPSESEIEAIRKEIGYKNLNVRLSPAALRKNIPALRVDLSAIAKGYAVDKLADILVSKGLKDMVVEIGGEMLIKGKNPNGKPWRIAVEKPLAGESTVERLFYLTDTGMATSGNYRNFFIEDGERYGHTINPATGKPVRHKLASATVLATTSAEADALATALMAMGDEKAVEFCKREKIAAYLMIYKGDAIQSIITENFSSIANRVAK